MEMINQNQVPDWVLRSREHLQTIAPKIGAIKKEGQAEANRGIEKVRKADDLEHECQYIARVLSQSHSSASWQDEIVNSSGSWLVNRVEALDSDIDSALGYAKAAGAAGAAYHTQFVTAMSSTDSSSGTAVYLTAAIERRFQAIEPTYSPVLPDFEPKRLTSRDTLLRELRTLLPPLGPQFVACLDGSEAGLRSSDPDSLSQAAHSMRDCFQQSIEHLAPSKVVESQPWFEPTEGAPGGISRRSRLRYMLYGSGEYVDDTTIRRLDDLSEIAKISLDLCIARAHDHDTSLTTDEVRLVIDQARNALLHVLKQHNDFRSR
jgi:hypothetical protein